MERKGKNSFIHTKDQLRKNGERQTEKDDGDE